jgi:Na+-transporting NADH:ubiquinone oxidoreductase subunit C
MNGEKKSDEKRGDGFFSERVYPVLFMGLVTIVSITIVSGIYLTTRDRVLLNESLFLKKAVLYAAGIPIPEDLNQAEAVFQERVVEVGAADADGDRGPFKISGEGGALDGWVVVVTGPGLWGEIEAAVGFEPDLETFTGIEFTKQNETPGLGARITEPWFKEQFRGKQGPFEMVPEGTASAPDELDAITGATRTSTFVLELVNRTVRNAPDLVEE